MPCPFEAEGQGQIPCLSLCRLVSWDFFREVSSEKCWGQSSTWICLQRGGRTCLLPDALPSRSRRPRTNSLFVSVSVCWWPCVQEIFFGKVLVHLSVWMPCPLVAEGQGQMPCLSLCLSACGLVSRRFFFEKVLVPLSVKTKKTVL